MKSTKLKVPRSERIFTIDPLTAPRLFRSSITCSMVEHALALHKLERIYQDGKALPGDQNLSQKMIEGMGVSSHVSDEDRAKIPKTGPVVVVANHPFGGLEGIVLHSLLLTVRQDVRMMVNYMLGRIPELRDIFILVNPFGTKNASRTNIRPLIQSLKFLQGGGMIGVFPSGEVSSIDLKSGRVRDPAWSPTIAGLVRRSQATVLPVYFPGRNSAGFQVAGLIHPRLRTMLLASMMDKQRNRVIDLRIGAPLPWRELSKFETDEELINYMRLRSYALESRDPEGELPRRKFRLPLKRRRAKQRHSDPVVDPAPPEILEAEIAHFPESSRMLTSGELDVYVERASSMPNLMRELGRLREITFRGVGEGTGREIDVDIFDDHYLHLFIWNHAKREVVGAYRLGLADEIVARFGVGGLYTHTLFQFDERLLARLEPAIELGRSFVRPEYQKAFSSLLLLWKGIGTFIARNPRYISLFGPVSITNEYRDDSRNMMLRALSLSNFSPELARLVKPRHAPKRKTKSEWANPAFEQFISDVDGVSAIIQDIETDHKGIPILLRQYLKLGGRLLAFNLDEEFSSVVDGLIAIDLRQTDHKAMNRYMGEESASAFRAYHQLG